MLNIKRMQCEANPKRIKSIRQFSRTPDISRRETESEKRRESKLKTCEAISTRTDKWKQYVHAFYATLALILSLIIARGRSRIFH